MKVPGGREVGENPWRRVTADGWRLTRFRGIRHYAIAGGRRRAAGCFRFPHFQGAARGNPVGVVERRMTLPGIDAVGPGRKTGPIMKLLQTAFSAFTALVLSASAEPEEGFVSLFDGKTFDGWKVAEDKGAFKIEDGAIVAKGERSHCFYVGKVNDGKFENFELRADVMTKPNSNGGIFIHSEWQDEGWPAKGYEVQVNNTQSDWRKSGGLYAVVDNKEPFEDNTWMKYVIRVEGEKITVSVNGKELVNHTPEAGKSKLQKGGGAIALQAHDPKSTILYKNLRIKTLK